MTEQGGLPTPGGPPPAGKDPVPRTTRGRAQVGVPQNMMKPFPRRARVQIEMDTGQIIEYVIDVADVQMDYNAGAYQAGGMYANPTTASAEVDLRVRGYVSSGEWKYPEPRPISVPRFDTPDQAQEWLDAQSKTG